MCVNTNKCLFIICCCVLLSNVSFLPFEFGAFYPNIFIGNRLLVWVFKSDYKRGLKT